MFGLILVIHIFGAVVMGVLTLFTFAKHADPKVILTRISFVLSTLFVVQALTGGALGLVSEEPSPLRMCANFILYLAVFIFVQAFITFRLGADKSPILRYASSSVLAGVALFSFSLVFLI